MSAVTDFLSNHSDLLAVATAAAVVTFLGFEAGWNSIMASDRNEQVFENKNKAYGAYRIRSMYGSVLAGPVFSGPLSEVKSTSVSRARLSRSRVANSSPMRASACAMTAA